MTYAAQMLDDIIKERDAALASLAAVTAERDALRKALEPFANDAPRHGTAADDTPLDSTPYEKRSRLTVGDLRRARAVLKEQTHAE